MATGRMRFYSVCQMRHTDLTFVIPNDLPPEMTAGNPNYARPRKNLYLLHGFSGGDCDWEYNGIADDIALQYNLNVFLPTGGNNFYLDREATGCQFGTFVGKEVIDYTRRTFGLSEKREDTLIGGLSMGGYGAMHTALAYPETFAAAICLSSALIIHGITDMEPGTANPIANYAYYREVFGDLAGLDKTDVNPEVLYRKVKESGRELPLLYMAIGTEDFLYEANQVTRQFLEKETLDTPGRFLYEEGEGIHDFRFWNKFVVRGLDWVLPKL